jgi:cytochrome c553
MSYVRLKIAVMVIAFSAAAVLAGHAENLAVRNCNWCHGGSGQGYTPAPRLAGQRHQYIENQLVDFRGHSRDNPFSKMYMWGAAANLSHQTARDLAIYAASRTSSRSTTFGPMSVSSTPTVILKNNRRASPNDTTCPST